MDTTYSLTINGKIHEVTTDPFRPLLEVLREDLQLTGSKYGCGEGSCRACTVLMDGRPVTACITPISKAANKTIVTIEGLAKDNELHPVQEAVLEEDAMQCGYCIPGMVLTAVSLMENNPNPTDDEINEWMNGNVCRCCGYPKLVAAVRRAADQNGAGGAP